MAACNRHVPPAKLNSSRADRSGINKSMSGATALLSNQTSEWMHHRLHCCASWSLLCISLPALMIGSMGHFTSLLPIFQSTSEPRINFRLLAFLVCPDLCAAELELLTRLLDCERVLPTSPVSGPEMSFSPSTKARSPVTPNDSLADSSRRIAIASNAVSSILLKSPRPPSAVARL